jgi:hypothetical protein
MKGTMKSVQPRANVAINKKGRAFRGARVLFLVGFAAVSCRESNPAGIAPNTRMAPEQGRLADISSADEAGWDTYSAVVTLRNEGGEGFEQIGANERKYRMTRTLSPDSSWHTTLIVLSDMAKTPTSSSRKVRETYRIELDGTDAHSFNQQGEELTRDIPNYDAAARDVRARYPGRFPDLSEPRSAQKTNARVIKSGPAGADQLVAGQGAGVRARIRLAALFSQRPTNKGELLHYSRTMAGTKLDVTVDSLTGAPLELTETRARNGAKVLRETRTELPGHGTAPSKVFIMRYDSVTVSLTGSAK